MAFSLDASDAFGSIGLILLLAGFVLNSLRRLDSAGCPYHWLNLLGSGILAGYAWAKESWVFLPLEVVWAAVAAAALVRKARERGAAAPT